MVMAKRALLTGITGQVGAYLARLLLAKGYEVYGAARRTSSVNTWRLRELEVEGDVRFVDLDVLEITNILRVLERVRPDEVYNLAAQSFVATSFEQPIYTANATGLGVAHMLEALRTLGGPTRFYQASSSEMFGKVRETPQTETTPFHPRSPYAIAKLFGHWTTVNHREAYDMHASAGILFNHESPLRGIEFVTRKITVALARIKQGEQDVLELGNLDAKRDWGFAGDFVEGIWGMVQQPSGDDYVLATGQTRSVRTFVEAAARALGFDIEWEGKDRQTVGRSRRDGRALVRVNPEFYRPAEVDLLIGSAEKARRQLGWEPTTSFEELVTMMAEADERRVRGGQTIL
jgi:GDPmannose 4,6-dehydratase